MQINFNFVVVLVLGLAGCYRSPQQAMPQGSSGHIPKGSSPAEVGLGVQAKAPVKSSASNKKPKTSLEEILAGFPKCEFDGLYIDSVTGKPANSYFVERNLEPCRIDKEIDSAYYCVKENFYGLPVYEIEIPAATAGFTHAIYIDLPIAEARKIVKRKFGSEFRQSKEAEEGRAPVLMADPDLHGRSFLMCASTAA